MFELRPLVLTLLCASAQLPVQVAKSFDAAEAFGARESITHLSMSPSGQSVAYIAPLKGQASAAYTLNLAKGSTPKLALSVDGKPLRLSSCSWVSNERLVCSIHAVMKNPEYGFFPISRVVAVNSDGTNVKVLSTRENSYSRGFQLGGGEVIDWLPDEDGAVLMTREYLPDDHVGTRIGNAKTGLGVDWIDTRTLAVKNIEPPRPEALAYITDGRGTVRITGSRANRLNGVDNEIIDYLYRPAGSR
jgi:hypothetical protein